MPARQYPSSYTQYPQAAGELFRAVQEAGFYNDSKHFVDARPRTSPNVIWERYQEQRTDPEFDLETFVNAHFELPTPTVHADEPEGETLEAHIDALWEKLRHDPVDPPTQDTHLNLPAEYITPGGRFREMYYWDTYFTSEGLAVAGQTDRIKHIIENFAHLIRTYGFIPNATRVYYLSRSQPPVFHRLLMILAEAAGFDTISPYLPDVEEEYEFWMDGVEFLRTDADTETPAYKRVVRVDDNTVLNRYWDSESRPRPEAYAIDRERGERVPPEDRGAVYRGLRAACESGWDFSSRWLATPDDMTSIRTTDLIPVDLNAFLYEREAMIAEWLPEIGVRVRAREYETRAEERRTAINEYCWDEDAGMYTDYCWTSGETTPLTIAGVVPLFTGVATDDRAAQVVDTLRDKFLYPGGVVTTLVETDHQWDKPCGWAPYQWMTIKGLQRYGYSDLAREIAERWVSMVRDIFEETGRVLEKYDVCNRSIPDTGEYPLQDGFGWTNGVVTALQTEFDGLGS